ncbi:MAG: inner-rane translocator, partial [Aeromicrobium sp.]|nr:inner-rane translocator [Aeromicrobium sp.]
YISVGDVGVFRAGMTGGRGYLALAAILFGGWRLSGLGVGVAIFAFTDATQLRLQSVGAIPSEVWVAVALVVTVAVAVGRLRLSGGRWRLDRRRPDTLDIAGSIVVMAMIVLVAVHPHLTLPVSIWLAMPYLLALAALAVGGNQRHRAPSALAIPYVRSEA